MNVRSALRLSPGVSLPLIDRIASDGDLVRHQEHTDRWNYAFVDCPEGSFPLGGGVEVQAVFVKKGRVIGIEEVRSVPAPEGLAYEVVIGRTGRFSRQTIRWNTDLTKSLYSQEEEGEDPDFLETMPLGDLIALSGRSARQIGQCVLNVVIGATRHAALHRGTSMAVPMRKVPTGDRALTRRSGSHRDALPFASNVLSPPVCGEAIFWSDAFAWPDRHPPPSPVGPIFFKEER